VAQFSPDGRRIATGAFARDYPCHIWQIPAVDSDIPAWLPALAETVAGLPIRTRGVSTPVAEGDFNTLRDQVNNLVQQEGFSRVARWFFADRMARTVSPFQSATVAEYIQRRIDENLRTGL